MGFLTSALQSVVSVVVVIAAICIVIWAATKLINSIKGALERGARYRRFEEIYGFEHPRRSAYESENTSVNKQLSIFAIEYVKARQAQEKAHAQFSKGKETLENVLITIDQEKVAFDILNEALLFADPSVLTGIYHKTRAEIIMEAEAAVAPRRQTKANSANPTPINRSA